MRKSLPSNIEAEQTLLGILLLEGEEAWDHVITHLQEDDFFQPAHRTIFSQIKNLYQKGQVSDLVTVGNSLKQAASLDQIGGIAYLSELAEKVTSTANIKAYTEIIREKALLRQIIRKSEEFIDKSYREDYSKIEHFMDFLESEVFKIGEERNQQELIPMNNLIESGLKKLEDLYKKKISVTGLSSSFQALDSLTSGFQPSELLILAARPSMGKTSLGLNFALHNALAGKTVAFFSLEMSREQVLMRLLSSLAKVNLSQLMNGQVSDHHWSEIISAAARLSESKLFIDDSSPLSPYEVRTKARRLKSQQGLDLIIIDYLQFMHLPDKKESREREVSEISKLLKSLAKELQIPIIAVAQLNRGVELRSTKRPILSDLRESGSIEQDADVIMMLYREDYYTDEDNPSHVAELIINKQRNGPTGTVSLKWLPEYSTFEDYIEASNQNIPLPTDPRPY
ncbi:MAG: replicative DNA helicase [Bdellovibrionales bacterium]